jgi:hypothetical protein
MGTNSWLLLHDVASAHRWLLAKRYRAQRDVFGTSSIFSRLVTAELCVLPQNKICSERQALATAMGVTASVTRAVTEVSKNCFQERFEKL